MCYVSTARGKRSQTRTLQSGDVRWRGKKLHEGGAEGERKSSTGRGKKNSQFAAEKKRGADIVEGEGGRFCAGNRGKAYRSG